MFQDRSFTSKERYEGIKEETLEIINLIKGQAQMGSPYIIDGLVSAFFISLAMMLPKKQYLAIMDEIESDWSFVINQALDSAAFIKNGEEKRRVQNAPSSKAIN